jgi:isoquinoline 1-oxidoreductase beta subunit
MEECTVKDGRIEQENFHTYDSMRIAQMPKVESIIMPSGGFWAASASRQSVWRRRRS